MSRSFNGTTDSLTAATITSVGQTGTGVGSTMAGWEYLVTATADQFVQVINSGNLASNGIGIYSRTPNAQGIGHRWGALFNGISLVDGGTLISAGAWNHYCITNTGDPSQTILYLNGVQGANGFVGNPHQASGGNTLIGVNTGGADVCYAADCACWSLALTPAEVAALAKGARPYQIRPASLTGWWPVDGKQSPEPDLSGKANNGTLSGTAIAPGPPLMMLTPRWPQTTAAGAPASSVVYRSTLSSLGTRTGSRQAQGVL